MAQKPTYNELLKKITQLEAALVLKPWIMDTKSDYYKTTPEFWYDTYLNDKIINYNYPVLINGETGTCREAIALSIHRRSHRKKAPFITINCSSFPRNLTEEQLFKADNLRSEIAIGTILGLFQYIHGGTIFFDEIGELSVASQVKLLSILERGTYESSIRFIAGTKKDLKNEVLTSKFRDDLYHYISIIPINILPLRKRKSDIPQFIEYYLKKESKKYEHQIIISKRALNYLSRYSWPGNLIELKRTIQYAIVKSTGDFIDIDDLPSDIKSTENQIQKRGPKKILERESVKTALKKTGYNKVRAAKELGVGRATLYRFLDEYPELVKDQ
jgi:DNA-binding NtrC family response regulator